MEYRKCGNFNSKNDSRLWVGASAFLKSVDFRAFAVNVKTIAPRKNLYQSRHAIWCERSANQLMVSLLLDFLSFRKTAENLTLLAVIRRCNTPASIECRPIFYSLLPDWCFSLICASLITSIVFLYMSACLWYFVHHDPILHWELVHIRLLGHLPCNI